ncbi:triphosphoribosyl-dephospho-CoA synthase [Dethiosulfatarculus sandiegensis]|uniref:Triphosphoribosyl-dephospho-CoA synthase n=1 Tax=Dethiosulfatarculus sandiegensis TaxID=1429043 RepID=A0A0D2J8T3_9BACT|nr:triphosphoribosyl-dephospho-CoA synthase [Dethiosulfatarculus sandiegensis]KIX12136.1 triphosphoribosyl-dephospho-CoA synthase [Dethiosulfatarculus sandiegensis]
MNTPTSLEVGRAAQLACVLEACAPKPGNVNPNHDFHDAGFVEFMASALALGPVMASAGDKKVGVLILDAIKATLEVAASNINLGIVLLLAPLAKAALGIDKGQNLKQKLAFVLADLDEKDALLAYRAINLANPSGLGEVDDQDVAKEPSGITLLQAMELSRNRDQIARQYVNGFKLVFDLGLPRLMRLWREGKDLSPAIVLVFLEILAKEPDTLIARKLGGKKAGSISEKARRVLLKRPFETPEGQKALFEFDIYLRDAKHQKNPGATADIMAAVLFVFLLEPEVRKDLPRVMRGFSSSV